MIVARIRVCALCALLAILLTERAGAADWPLRGSVAPPTYVRWDGAQAGVEVGWGNFRNDFGRWNILYPKSALNLIATLPMRGMLPYLA